MNHQKDPSVGNTYIGAMPSELSRSTMTLMRMNDFLGTCEAYGTPNIFNLEWDLREEHPVDSAHFWVAQPMAAAAGAFLKSLAIEPPIKPGTPDPCTPPEPGQLVPQEYLQIGPIVQFATTLHYPNGGPPPDVQHQPDHGLSHASGA